MTPEAKVVSAVKSFVVARGGLVRKCAWEGRAGAPDLFVMYSGRHAWVECKAPGERPRVSQVREFERMRSLGGCAVFCVDSVGAFVELWAAFFAVGGAHV